MGGFGNPKLRKHAQEVARILLDSWTHLPRHERLRQFGSVLLENHLHAVAQASDLLSSWSRFTSYTGYQLIDLHRAQDAEALLRRMRFAYKAHRNDREHQFWREGSHPLGIEGKAMLRQELECIHQNPVKRGYVDEPEHWRRSSARNYAGREGLMEVFTDW